MPKTSPSPDHRDQPTYWFAVMEIARESGDFDGAAEAKRQLKRLGVTIKYGRPERAMAPVGSGRRPDESPGGAA